MRTACQARQYTSECAGSDCVGVGVVGDLSAVARRGADGIWSVKR